MLKLFALLVMTFMLVSCGGGKSTATLSISRGMFLSNTSFTGGIYIAGFKADGSETFISTITAGNSTDVTISLGTWDFKVVGWDGGAAMVGTPYCKFVDDFQFTTAGQQLEILTSNAECFGTSSISGTNQHITANAGPFKQLVVNSCGAMYNPSDSSALTTTANFDPCTNGNYPTEFRKTYPYFKIELVNQNIAGVRTPGIMSSCLTARTANTVQFPNKLPVTLRFYSDSSCTKEVDEYRFKLGLDSSLSLTRSDNEFDWSVTSDSAKFFVTLPHGASKRGTTAFHTETPIFKCLEAGDLVPCTKLPVTTVGVYYVDPDKYAVIVLPQSTCGTITYGSFTATTYSCDVFNGKAYVGFKVDSTTPVNGTLSMNGASYTVKVGNTNAGFTADHVRDAYKTLKRALGIRSSENFDDSLQDDFDEGGDPTVGFLDPAIYEISPMGAGGAFYDYYNQCSVSPLAQVSRAYVKNGFSYTVLLSGINGIAPGFTARSDEPEFMGSEVHYNRRILVRKLVGPTLVTEKIIDFSCDNFDTNSVAYASTAAQVRNGKMEEQRTYTYGHLNKSVTLKKKIFWNTSSSDTSRFDVYRSKHVTMGGTTQKIEREFYRVSKSLTDIYNHFKIHSMSYYTVRDGSSYDETILVNEVDGKESSGQMLYSHKRGMDYSNENGTVGNIFDTTYAHELNKIRFGYHQPADEQEQSKVSSVGNNFVQARKVGSNLEIRFTDSGLISDQTESFPPDNIATDISDDGLKMIVAANFQNTIYYYIISGGVVTPATFTTSFDPTEIKVGIRNDGSWIVGYIESTTNLVKWKVDGTSHSSPYTSYTHKQLDIYKDGSEFYLNFRRSSGSPQYLELCKSGGACNGYASRVSSNEFTYSSLHLLNGTFFATYVHNATLFNLSVNPSTLVGGTQTMPPVRKFTPYLGTMYTALDSSTVLRTTTGTPVETDYPYFNPTITGFQMKPSYLNQSGFESYFTSGFSSVTN